MVMRCEPPSDVSLSNLSSFQRAHIPVLSMSTNMSHALTATSFHWEFMDVSSNLGTQSYICLDVLQFPLHILKPWIKATKNNIPKKWWWFDPETVSSRALGGSGAGSKRPWQRDVQLESPWTNIMETMMMRSIPIIYHKSAPFCRAFFFF